MSPFAIPQAIEWQDAVYRQLRQLELMPESHGLAHESVRLGVELRQKTVGLGRGNYRAVFRMDGHTVLVLAVRRASQDDLTTDVLDPGH